MSTKKQIIETADRLFYERGFEKTSFADIAKKIKISRGNFYYHFKTKDEILAAVIDYRKEKTRKMIEAWDAECEDPKGRILCYINILIANQFLIRDYGCPVGTLTNELAKLDHIAKSDAKKIFTVFHNWLMKQFSLLGFSKNADDLSMHVLSWSQGTATMYNAFQDEGFLTREVKKIHVWLDRTIEGK